MRNRRKTAKSAGGDEAIARGENRGLIRRYYEELWNEWNLGVAEEIISPEITFRGSLAVTVRGLDGFKSYVALVRSAFPDFHNTIEELVAEGDCVAARLTYRGTHRGQLFEIAPTGKAIAYAGAAFFHIRGRKIVEGWVLGDTAALMRQLGAVSTQGGGGSGGGPGETPLGSTPAGSAPVGSTPGPR